MRFNAFQWLSLYTPEIAFIYEDSLNVYMISVIPWGLLLMHKMTHAIEHYPQFILYHGVLIAIW